jgi:hypothetical protein
MTHTPGTGNRTIRLADIPIERRLLAVSYLARRELIKTESEQAALLAIAIHPGDKGGRIT